MTTETVGYILLWYIVLGAIFGLWISLQDEPYKWNWHGTIFWPLFVIAWILAFLYDTPRKLGEFIRRLNR